MDRCPNCGTIHQHHTESGFCFRCIVTHLAPPPDEFLQRIRKSIDLVAERTKSTNAPDQLTTYGNS